MANVPISAFTVGANTTGIGASGYSLTGSAANSYIDLAGTWNTSGTPTAIKLNITDTASNAASLLMDLQTGGTSRFNVKKSGKIRLSGGGGFTQSDVDIGNADNNGFVIYGGTIAGIISGVSRTLLGGTQFELGNITLAFGGGFAGQAAPDLILARDAANTLAQRNSTNAQTFRVYNTFTDASNYERGIVRWSTNTFEVGTEAAGTGTARNLLLSAAGAYVSFGPSGAVTNTANVNNTSGLVIDSRSGRGLGFFNGSASTSAYDTWMGYAATGVIAVRGSSAANGCGFELLEMTAPAAPAANSVRIYAQDNGSGKTQLMALFATGAAQQIAIEP